MSDSHTPSKTKWRKMTRLVPFIRPHRLWAALMVVHHGVERISSQVFIPFLLQQVTDSVVRDGLQYISRWAALFMVLLVIGAVSALVGRRAHARYTAFTIRDLRNRVTEHIQQLPMGYLENQRTGDLVSRLNTDVTTIEGWLPLVRELAIQPLLFIAGVIYMLSISWKLFLASTVLIPVSAMLFNRVNKPMEAIARRQAEGEGRVNAAFQDMLDGIVAVKAFNLHALLGQRFGLVAREVEREALHLDGRRAVSLPIFLALRYVPQLIVPLFGGYLAFQGDITVGQLLAANLVIWMVFLPIERLLDVAGKTRETIPAVERLITLLDQATEPQDGEPLVRRPEAPPLRLRGVSFAYPDQGRLLEDITFDVARGETVALVGASGCGKSTLLKLLIGFYAPTGGAVDLYGNDLARVDLAQVREQVALMGQEPYLFPTTIADNIAYGRPGATEAEIIAAAKAAHAHDFILTQPQGYQTQVGERGARLSGGERQRIALARTMLKDAPILLLDEPTASLDAQSEALIQAALERFTTDRTVLIVAHRLATFQHADRILVLDRPEEDGAATICEEGTHSELMASDTHYRRLYVRQAATMDAESGDLL